jgi:hypothetical protein
LITEIGINYLCEILKNNKDLKEISVGGIFHFKIIKKKKEMKS